VTENRIRLSAGSGNGTQDGIRDGNRILNP